MNEPHDPEHGADVESDRVLRDNLRVPALSPEALARIRLATEAEWRANVRQSPRRWMPLAVAASVALLATAVIWNFVSDGSMALAGDSLATLARAPAPGVVELRPLWRESAVNVGSEVRAGQDLAARGGALLALHGGGNLRIAPGSELEVLSANSVRLQSGELYVDIPPGAHPDASFVAVTDAGEFRHVGTQFALAVIDGGTRLRVREGRVAWAAGEGGSTVDAGTEVLIDRHHQVTRRPLDASGEMWSWTAAMSPDIDIEGRPLSEFLDWVARETGRKLVIADDATRQQVATISMHGSVHGLVPMDALHAVMASTSLRFDLPEGAIRVSLASESPPPR
jgi:ferric-dicitrate binding protein FerR (iron transport regulator)